MILCLLQSSNQPALIRRDKKTCDEELRYNNNIATFV